MQKWREDTPHATDCREDASSDNEEWEIQDNCLIAHYDRKHFRRFTAWLTVQRSRVYRESNKHGLPGWHMI